MATTQNKDYYATLGVKKTATPEEIRKAFQESCAALSPGREPRRQEGRGEVQGDLRGQRRAERREEAQGLRPGRLLLRPDRPGDGGGVCAAAERAGRPPVDFDGFDFSGFQGGPGFNPGPGRGRVRSRGAASRTFFPASSPGRSSPQRPRGPQPGTDLEYQATVDFWTAIRGGQARIQVNRQETCPTCHGQAQPAGVMQCPECNGTGQVTQMGGRMKFNIPARAATGRGAFRTTANLPRRRRGEPDRVGRVPHQAGHARRAAHSPAGQGQRGHQRRAAGDLFLIVRTGTHPVFTRVGDDIHLTVPVTIAEASAGREGGRADDRRARAVEDSAGHAERAETAHARARRGECAAARPARRPDCDRGSGGAHAAGRAQPRDHARVGQAE
jgi:molecular chaperone DnaJ